MPAIASVLELPLSTLFLGYVGLVASLIVAVLLRYLPLGRALISVAVIAVWLGYAGIMGYSGILIGFSAPLIALIATRGAVGRRVALVWNVVGLLSLLNVAARAVLTAPGPLNLIHAELPNVAMGMFPFSYIPGFMAPLAMMLHVLAFRALRRADTAKQSTSTLQYA